MKELSGIELREAVATPDGSEPPMSKKEQLALALASRYQYANGGPRPTQEQVREKKRLSALRYSRSAKGKKRRAENYQRNKDRIKAKRRAEYVHDRDADLRYKLKNRYGITGAEYAGMKEAQRGLCAICGKGDKGKRLCVDHCHATGSVRGLLCNKCNVGLANYRDNPDLLRRAAAYLEARNG